MTYATGSPDVHVTGRRVVATIIDSVVLGFVSSILSAAFGIKSSSSGLDLTALSTGGSFVLLVVALLYYVLMEAYVGRTVGKILTGIRVVDEASGGRPGLGQAALRTILRIVDAFFAYLVAFVVVQASSRRRRLGDMVARTLVVRT